MQHDGLVIVTLDFQGQMLKRPYDRNRRANDMEWKWCESIGRWTHFVTLNFDPTRDTDLGFPSSNFKKLYLRNGWSIVMERKGGESIKCRTHYVILIYDLDLGQIVKYPYPKNRRDDWHGMKDMRVDRLLDPLCDPDL